MQHTRARLDGILQTRDMEPDEKIILEELIHAGYGENGSPLGFVASLSAEHLAELHLKHFPPKVELDERNYEHHLLSRKRRIRTIINNLIIQYDIPICCQAGALGGYYLPAEDREIEEHYKQFHKRAMTGLMKATRARRAAYADAVLQLSFGFDSKEGEELRRRMGFQEEPRKDGPPVWVKLVTQLLERIESDPVKYADQIRAIQNRFGDIFVPRHKVEALKEATSNLQALLASIE